MKIKTSHSVKSIFIDIYPAISTHICIFLRKHKKNLKLFTYLLSLNLRKVKFSESFYARDLKEIRASQIFSDYVF